MTMDRQPRSTPSSRHRSDLRAVVGSSASAYDYTLTAWSAGTVLSPAYGPPSPPQVFSFILGTVVGFAVAGALAFGALRGGVRRRGEPSAALWGSFHFVSVALAVVAAWFLSAHVVSLAGWRLGSFVATGLMNARIEPKSRPLHRQSVVGRLPRKPPRRGRSAQSKVAADGD